jgi:diaminopimelate epimerase
MKLSFTKMHGAGNDFVMIENLRGEIALSTERIAALCDRRFGVGGDGLMLLERPPEDHSSLDARMVYFNADGSRAEMCGNGARCFAAFALAHGVGRDGGVSFLTDAGPISVSTRDGLYTIRMTPPRDLRIGQEIGLKAGSSTIHLVNTGVPHAVRFVDDVKQVQIRPEGAELRYHPAFAPKGANANFAQVQADGLVLVRTYERGVEDETLACGTGVTAVGILAHLVHGVPAPVSLRVAGGDTLFVNFRRNGETLEDVTLTGPAAFVFRGEVELA